MPELTAEQLDACDRLFVLAQRSRALQVLEGPGGSGKSTVTGELATRLCAEGWPTLFTTNSHSALGACPGTGLVLASLMFECRRGRHPRKTPLQRTVARWFDSPRRVLVLDEAFQLTAERLLELFSALAGRSRVERGGTRVILVGDPGQMKPIGGKPITSLPDVSCANWTRLTSGTMRMTAGWAREVQSFSDNVMFADASLAQFRRRDVPADTMIITPTRRESLDATRLLAGPAAITILPVVPDEEELEMVTSEERKACEPFIFDPRAANGPARLVYNVRTADGERSTPGGFGLNNNARVQFVGIVDKNDELVEMEPGSSVQMTKDMRFCVLVEGESARVVLAPLVVSGILVAPLRWWGVKTVHAAQGETLDSVHLYANGPVKQSVYVTAAGRVRCETCFSVSQTVTRVAPDE